MQESALENSAHPLINQLNRQHGLRNRYSAMSGLGILALIVLLAITLLAPGSRSWANEANLPVVKVVSVPRGSIAIMGEGAEIQWDKPGWMIELLLEVGKRSGVKFDFERVPWKRCLRMIEHGKADVTFSSSYKLDRAKYSAYPMKDSKPDATRAIRHYVYNLYRNKESTLRWDGKNLSKLKGTIAIKLGDSIIGPLKKAGVNVIEVRTYKQALLMTERKRVEGAAIFEGYGAPIIKVDPGKFSNLIKETIPLQTKVGYLMFSKVFYMKSNELVENIWKTLAEMRSSGEITKIKSRYIEMN